jgi:PAS domain-containing protein
LLPLANHGDRRLTGLVLFPSPLGPQRLERACTGVAFGSGAAAVIAAAFGWLGKRRNAELERRLALLRNLQVGVIEVNARTEITFANDRAEELFGTCLAKGRATGAWSRSTRSSTRPGSSRRSTATKRGGS